MIRNRRQPRRSGAASGQPEPRDSTSSTDRPTAWTVFSNWSLNAPWRRMIFRFIVIISILGTVSQAIPKVDDAIEYSILKFQHPSAFGRTLSNELTSKSGVRVVERATTLYLGGWKWTSSKDLAAGSKISRGLSTTTFTLQKTEPGAKYFVHTVSSDSKVAPSISSDSHPFRVIQANDQGSSKTHQWNVLVDVSQEPDDRPFTVGLVVTFWNGFQTKHDWWAGFRILHSTEKATFQVIFPADLPATNPQFRFKDTVSGKFVPLDTATLKLTVAPSEMSVRTLSWTIDNPQPDRSYQVTWTWPDSAAAMD
jgi:hypothetical protein